MVPWLAESIPTIDNGGVAEDLTSISWTLKEGLEWSDGTPGHRRGCGLHLAVLHPPRGRLRAVVVL